MDAAQGQAANPLRLRCRDGRPSGRDRRSGLGYQIDIAPGENVPVVEQSIDEVRSHDASLGVARYENYISSMEILHPFLIVQELFVNPCQVQT